MFDGFSGDYSGHPEVSLLRLLVILMFFQVVVSFCNLLRPRSK